MLHRARIFAAVAITALTPAFASATPMLYGVSFESIFIINTSTGAPTAVLNIASHPTQQPGAEFVDGKLWVSSGFGSIGTYDLATGVYSIVGVAGSWHGLAANEETNTLYGVDNSSAGRNLRSMTTAGVFADIGPTNTLSISGLAYDNANDILYGVGYSIGDDGIEGNHLFSINPLTGATVEIGATGVPDGFGAGTGLAYAGSLNTLFMNTSGDALYALDTTTGAATIVGSNRGFNIGALAWLEDTQPAAIPEPASMLLLGSGVAGLIALRRRRS